MLLHTSVTFVGTSIVLSSASAKHTGGFARARSAMILRVELSERDRETNGLDRNLGRASRGGEAEDDRLSTVGALLSEHTAASVV